jgi:hypothetical protein
MYGCISQQLRASVHERPPIRQAGVDSPPSVLRSEVNDGRPCVLARPKLSLCESVAGVSGCRGRDAACRRTSRGVIKAAQCFARAQLNTRGAGLRDPHTSPSGPAKRGGARTARHGRARNRAEHSRGYRSRTANANTHDVVAAAAASRAASLMSSAACHSIAVCARQQWARGGAPTP